MGTLGFVGNCLTFLHPTIRRNTCSIYSLCSTISDELDLLLNLFPDYLAAYGYALPLTTISSVCKFVMFKRMLFPQLSISFLILALIDRFACSCGLTSTWRKINQRKIVPWTIGLAILYSLSIGVLGFIFFDITPPPNSTCVTTQLLLSSILYIVTSTIVQLLLFSIFTFLLFKNVKRSRQRVNVALPNRLNRQFIRMTIVQVVVTGFLSIQWIIVYAFDIIKTQNMVGMTLENITIFAFVVNLSYQIYYINNVKFFYLSTLTSSLYRKTFQMAIAQYLPRNRRFQRPAQNRDIRLGTTPVYTTKLRRV